VGIPGPEAASLLLGSGTAESSKVERGENKTGLLITRENMHTWKYSTSSEIKNGLVFSLNRFNGV